MTGGAPMPVEVMSAFERRFRRDDPRGLRPLRDVAGGELHDARSPRKAGSIGYPGVGRRDGDRRRTRRAAADGERGEIVIRGHNVMKGYWKRPDATRRPCATAGSTAATSASATPTGCYFIVDRKKDMILRGGFNVYPREVEESALRAPGRRRGGRDRIPHDSHGEE